MASEKQINEVIETLFKVYGKEPGDMRGFYWALSDANYDTLLDAAKVWVRGNKWMPSPSELRELCAKAEAETQALDEPRRIRQYAYMLFNKYRDGEITLEQFRSDSGVKYVCKQYGIFSALFEDQEDTEATVYYAPAEPGYITASV